MEDYTKDFPFDHGITVEILYEEPPQDIWQTVIQLRSDTASSLPLLRVTGKQRGSAAIKLPSMGANRTRVAIAALDRTECIQYSGVDVIVPGSSQMRITLRKLAWPICN